MRRVRQERGVPDKERLFLGDRHVDEVGHRLHPFASDLQAGVAVAPAALWVAVRHAVGEAAVLPRAFPPLARLMGEVAVGHERFDE